MLLLRFGIPKNPLKSGNPYHLPHKRKSYRSHAHPEISAFLFPSINAVLLFLWTWSDYCWSCGSHPWMLSILSFLFHCSIRQYMGTNILRYPVQMHYTPQRPHFRPPPLWSDGFSGLPALPFFLYYVTANVQFHGLPFLMSGSLPSPSEWQSPAWPYGNILWFDLLIHQNG